MRLNALKYAFVPFGDKVYFGMLLYALREAGTAYFAFCALLCFYILLDAI